MPKSSSITMSKTKEHSYDVQQKSVELHKIESGCKKISKELSHFFFFCQSIHFYEMN